ncbi:hypothetical protein ACFL0V_02500 [Nanoarchaeota archaeon]
MGVSRRHFLTVALASVGLPLACGDSWGDMPDSGVEGSKPEILQFLDIEDRVNRHVRIEVTVRNADTVNIHSGLEDKAANGFGQEFYVTQIYVAPGIYTPSVIAYNSEGFSRDDAVARILDFDIDRMGESLGEITTTGSMGVVNYQDWLDYNMPLLEDIGVSSGTRSRIESYQNQGKDIVQVWLFEEENLLVYELGDSGYYGMNGTVYEGLEIPAQDAENLAMIL